MVEEKDKQCLTTVRYTNEKIYKRWYRCHAARNLPVLYYNLSHTEYNGLDVNSIANPGFCLMIRRPGRKSVVNGRRSARPIWMMQCLWG